MHFVRCFVAFVTLLLSVEAHNLRSTRGLKTVSLVGEEVGVADGEQAAAAAAEAAKGATAAASSTNRTEAVAASVRGVSASKLANSSRPFAPYNGAAYLKGLAIDFQDLEPAPGLKITKLAPLSPEQETAGDGCHAGDQADRDSCLTTPGAGCMWTHVETDDPKLEVQASNSYCTPCELDGHQLPCWSVGAWLGDMVVRECAMSCSHQLRMHQPYNGCDGPGGSSKADCFARGDESGSKCLYLAYEDPQGTIHSQCGSCELPGSGVWGCPEPGYVQEASNNTILSCASQCEPPCTGENCPPSASVAAVATPGVAKVSSPSETMVSAPDGRAPDPPQSAEAVLEAARLKAAAAGHPYSTSPAPKKYTPVVVYRTPGDYAATTIPPLESFEPAWPVAWKHQTSIFGADR